jgi:hypothetical protein
MRRTLKLLLFLGIGILMATNKGPDGSSPSGSNNSTDPNTGKPKSDEQRKEDSTYKGTNAQEDFSGVLEAADQESQAGRSEQQGERGEDVEDPPSSTETEGQFTQEQLDEAFESANTPAKLEHVIDPDKHGFQDLVKDSGGRSEAMRRIVDTLNDVPDLPDRGRFEVDRVINGEVVTIRGAVVNGIPRLGTAFISSKFPGGS